MRMAWLNERVQVQFVPTGRNDHDLLVTHYDPHCNFNPNHRKDWIKRIDGETLQRFVYDHDHGLR
jgi:hypothetical protein